MKKILIALLLSFISLSASAFSPIPVDKAFELTVKPLDNHTFMAQWKIAPGYHLYRDRIHFEAVKPSSAKIGTINYPTGIQKEDDILGKYQIYENAVAVTVPMANAPAEPMTLEVNYQGCADSGFCYPPVTKQMIVNLGNTGSATSGANVSAVTEDANATNALSQQDKISDLLAHQNLFIILLGFLGFGILLAFTPCVLPMVPILSGIIVGAGKEITGMKAFWLSLTYVLAMAVTYACAGVVAGLAGSYVQSFLQSPYVLAIFSGVFVLLSLSLFGFYELRMPSVLQNRMTELSNKQSGGNYVGVAAMGCLSTLIVSPCVSAPLIGALSYIGRTGNAVLGGTALFTMGLGMGIPLLIIGTVGGKFLPKAGGWMDAVKSFFGVLMLGVAILLLSRVIPGSVTMLLWAALLIFSAVFMGVFNTVPATGYAKMWKGCSVILLVYGVLLLIGAGMGNADPFTPIAMKQTSQLADNQPQVDPFKKIKSMADLRAALAQAKGKPVILDFYADWCLSCKEMDRNTFTDPKVQASLKQFVLLRADVTANDNTDKNLEKKLSVIAPPSIIFFDQKGNELSDYRIVGAVGAKEFSQHLQEVLG